MYSDAVDNNSLNVFHVSSIFSCERTIRKTYFWFRILLKYTISHLFCKVLARPHSFPRPLFAGGKSAEVLRKSISPKNSFRKTESELMGRASRVPSKSRSFVRKSHSEPLIGIEPMTYSLPWSCSTS